VAEALRRRGEDVLADDCAAGQDRHDAGVVADRAHVAHMVRKPLQLGHDAAQQDGARRHVPAKRRFGRQREGEAIGDGAVARDARGDFAGLSEGCAGAERFDALVDVAQPLLQPRDGLAIAGEAEMAGLDDARMHGANRDLVQAGAVHGKEVVALLGS